jgi:hypothetical protein
MVAATFAAVFGGRMMLRSVATDPMVPPSLGILGFLMILSAALFIVALISIARNRTYSSGGTVVWALIVFAFPMLGPVLWFSVGRRARQDLPAD